MILSKSMIFSHYQLRSSSKNNLSIKFLYRLKVDLTKFIESHNFTFDNVFDSRATN
jgi:hypothetical protein